MRVRPVYRLARGAFGQASPLVAGIVAGVNASTTVPHAGQGKITLAILSFTLQSSSHILSEGGPNFPFACDLCFIVLPVFPPTRPPPWVTVPSPNASRMNC
jgi:hypothetical protein